MHGMPTFVAYYTKDTPYERESAVLRESLDTLNLPYEFVPIDSLGSWQANTQVKAEIIRAALDSGPRHICYIDVDAVVLHRPVHLLRLRHMPVDLSVYVSLGGAWKSGTIYLACNDKSRRLVDRWVEINDQYPETLPDGREAWDQRTLHMAWEETREAQFAPLPPEYTYTVGYSQEAHPEVNPIILHTRGALKHK
jgi:hypothetical protein